MVFLIGDRGHRIIEKDLSPAASGLSKGKNISSREKRFIVLIEWPVRASNEMLGKGVDTVV